MSQSLVPFDPVKKLTCAELPVYATQGIRINGSFAWRGSEKACDSLSIAASFEALSLQTTVTT
jgi:hypothetical protein